MAAPAQAQYCPGTGYTDYWSNLKLGLGHVHLIQCHTKSPCIHISQDINTSHMPRVGLRLAKIQTGRGFLEVAITGKKIKFKKAIIVNNLTMNKEL